MKITEIRIYPGNQNPIIESVMEGEYSSLMPLLDSHCKSLDRRKIDYIYKVEGAPANYYKFSLKRSEFDFTLKYIPDLEKTW